MISLNRMLFSVMMAGAIGWFSACDGDDEPDTAEQDFTVSTFLGNSVRIQGARSPAADAKYPCASSFDVCLPFLDAAGHTAAITNLCPTIDDPMGTWTFEYTLFSDAACVDPLNNALCPDTTGETLDPGANHNTVVCATQNATKDFDFDLCVVDNPDPLATNECRTACVTDASCPGGWVCGADLRCTFPCTLPTDCFADYVCLLGECQRGCGSTIDCEVTLGVGTVCDPVLSVCILSPACTLDAECTALLGVGHICDPILSICVSGP